MRKEELSKHFGYGTWLLILFAAGAILFGFPPASHANEAPVITGQVELSTPEDTPLIIALTDLTVSDPDNVYPTEFTLLVLEGSNYSFAGNTITPALNWNGTLSVPVTVNDGTVDSAVFNLSVTVTPVNDAPVISPIPDQETDEDTSVGPIEFMVGDEETSSDDLTVTATSDKQELVPDGNIIIGGNGGNRTVTVTPAADANGVAAIMVTVSDGTDSSIDTFLLTVIPVNDAPTAILISKNTVDENQPVGTVVGVFSTADPDVDQTHVYTLVAGEGGDDNSLFIITGDQLLTAESFDYETKNTYRIRVRSNDQNGGSYEEQFIITIGEINEDITLAWDADPDPESGVTGYKVYYKTESSGDRILSAYTGEGLVWLRDDNTSLTVDSWFEVKKEDLSDPALPSIRLGGLDGRIIYFFVVTAVGGEGDESLPSREVSTDDAPPTQPDVLSGSQVPGERQVSFEWSPSTDPDPGSGLAGYSYILDAFPDTTPDAVPNLGLVTSETFYVPYDGRYWFHIRAVDKAGLEGRNASLTEHYGPVCIDTGPPIVDYAFIDYESKTLYVIYSETHLQNAAQQSNYSFDNGLLMLGDGTDLYGDGMVFSFLLDSGTLDRYLIYSLTIAENITDCAGNSVSRDQGPIVISDDDRDGMADEWERLWFGSTWPKDGLEDSDGDGVLDLDEYLYAKNHPELGANRWALSPLDADSDNDGIPDGYEILPEHGLNPTNPSDWDLDPDQNGLTNSQEYINSIVAPAINPIPDDWSGEWTAYIGPAPSLSQGSLPVTWSLVSGPTGMEIDPISGEVYWPEPTLDGSPHSITIRVENWTNSSFFDEKTWLLAVVPVEITVYVNASNGDDGNGEGSLESPWKSISYALSDTQGSLSPWVTIRIASGRYEENIIIPRSGIGLEGGWNGLFSQRWDFVKSGVEPLPEYETIIDGQSAGSVIVAGSDTTIDGFTITGGNGTNGGGISGGEWVSVSNCKIFGNAADIGGGIYARAGSVTRCLFLNNIATPGDGGGIYLEGGDPWSASISECTFRGNSADTGGGILNINSSPSIQNCLFVDNTATDGGAIANKSSSPEIVNCTFAGNTAAEYGGAVGNFLASMPTLINSILWGNRAGVSGNEIHIESGSTAYISYCDIEGSGGSGETWESQFGTDLEGNIDADPLFVNRYGSDNVAGNQDDNFHLGYGSPCIKTGIDYGSGYSGMGCFPSVTVGTSDWAGRDCDFASIQEAMDYIGGTGLGGSVLVMPGTYGQSGGTLVMRDRISLMGAGASTATVRDSVDANDAGAESTISGFTISSAGFGISIGHLSDRNINLAVRNNIIRDCDYSGISISGNSSPVIVNNTIINNTDCGIRVFDSSSQVTVRLRNNIIASNGLCGIAVDGTANLDGDYNDVWNNGIQNYFNTSPGSHDFSIDPLFIDPLNHDYHLEHISPCVDAGDPASDYSREPEPNGERINLGAYGGTPEATTTPPLITGQRILSTPEETALPITLADLTVNDPTNMYPTGFTLQVHDGSNYTHAGTRITPALNFNGTLSVPVTVNDGTVESAVYTLSVSVTAVNDPVAITDITDQLTEEDAATRTLEFTVGDVETPAEGLTVTGSSDNQNLVPDGNIAFGGSGATRTVTVTPAANQSGTATITIMVGDGEDSTNETFFLTVTGLNDAPVVRNDSAVTDEDTPVTIDVLANDSDVDGDLLTIMGITQGSNGSVSIVGSSVTYTPNANFIGTDQFTYTASDGQIPVPLLGRVFITVSAVSDAPTNTVLPVVSGVLEEGQVLSVTDGTWQNNSNPVGPITYGYQWRRDGDGVAGGEVPIAGATSSAYTLGSSDLGKYLSVAVTATANTEGTTVVSSFAGPVVNSAPVITQGAGPLNVTMSEDGVPTPFIAPALSATDANSGGALTWSVLTPASHGTATVSGTEASPTTFTYAPVANYNGADSFVVQVSDGSAADTIRVDVTVTPVSDAPVINFIPDSFTGEWAPYIGETPTLSQGDMPITWSLVSAPPGMEIDSMTGEVYWPNPKSYGSPYAITIRAENVAGFDEETFVLTVVPDHIALYVNGLTGDDGAGDGSPEQPWKTIGFALSQTQGSLSPLATIVVSAGHYSENIIISKSEIELQGGWNSAFTERWDFVQDGVEPSSPYETILDGGGAGPVIVAGSDTTIDGFTITGGNAFNGGGISGGAGLTVSNCKVYGNAADLGGGMYTDAPVIVTRSLFLNNSAKSGGGIYSENGGPSTVAIAGCTFRENSADTGGGIFNINSSPSIQNCLFVDNTATDGGAIANKSSSPEIVNCTFSENTAAEYGGAMGNFVGSMPTVRNSILWGDVAEISGNEIYNDSGSTAYVSYSDIKGSGGSGIQWDNRIGTDEGGNIDADPLFADPMNNDYHLKYLSPCIDAGDPSSDYSREPEPNGGRINLGAFGGTPEATTTIPPVITGQVALTTQEDTGLTITLADLTVTDPDNTYPTGFTLSVQDGDNYTNAGNTITPALNFNGILSVPVTVGYGTVQSPVFTLSVTVTPVNDPVAITDITDQLTEEDTATRTLGFTVGDVETSVEDLMMTGSSDNQNLVPDGNIVFGGSGATRTVTVTPVANQSGTATITIVVSDGMGSTSETFLLTVTAVNDAPTDIVLSGSAVDERQPVGTRVGTFSTSDRDGGQTHVYSLVEGAGGEDNSSFVIVGNQLLTAESFDSKTKDIYRIRVKTDDQNGGTYEKPFTVAVRNLDVEITLEWPASSGSEVTGYKVYYKTESSGDGVLGSYTGKGLVLLNDDGTSLGVDSGFMVRKENLPDPAFPSCRLGEVRPTIVYFFVVTTVDSDGHEGLPSMELSTDSMPPSKPVVLSGSQVPGAKEISFMWSASTDPAPSSGMAGYSYVIDTFPDTTPEATADLGLVTSATFDLPLDGCFWFHIRGVDKAGLEGPNASETEHYGPVCIDTGPPVVDYAYIDYENSTLYVSYSETHMQNAAHPGNYSFDHSPEMLGGGADVYGDSRVFRFPLNPTTLEPCVIYAMRVTQSVTDASGNPLPSEVRSVQVNDDDNDGMADDWEALWFEDINSKDGSDDSDGDGLMDLEEYRYARQNWGIWGDSWWHLSPTNTDSDEDGAPDKYEIDNGLNPTDGSDGDPDDGTVAVPRYRLYNHNNGQHHYTTNANEYSVLESWGWIPEGISCYLYTGTHEIDSTRTVPYYRLYNPNSGEHHWTVDANEYYVLGTIGWIQEGVDGHVFASQVRGCQPLYRLYNPNDGLHHWTMNAYERSVLIGYGWIDEGIACYVSP